MFLLAAATLKRKCDDRDSSSDKDDEPVSISKYKMYTVDDW